MLLDNKSHGRVGETLANSMGSGCRLSIATAAFSIYGYDALRDALAGVDSARLLLSPDGGALASDATGFHLPELAGSDGDRRFRNQLGMAVTAKACAEWLERAAEIRAAAAPVPQNLFHVASESGPGVAIHGSSTLTSSGLGVTPSPAFEMNTCYSTPDETNSLLGWFGSMWEEARFARDVKPQVLAQLEEMYSPKSSELIYFLTLYNIFRDSLGELEEDRIINPRTGIKDTVVWSKLYRFQRDGVLGAIDKIEKYQGCIIADSVGLGKTFEALAIIKYYELRNDRVLVLAPKKLRENWTIYTVNDKRNLFAADRFNYDVLNHTDLSRTSGHSGEINLQTVNWGNYDLIVIDESHNFRNNPPRTDGTTRYTRLMRDIIQSGVKTKVLMLSATPVNSRMNDLKNQVAFITEGNDSALADNGILSIEHTLRAAQTRFNEWLKLAPSQRDVNGLLEMLNLDYFKLLDLLTIARSRKHIEKYYDMVEVGRFPRREKPINIKADIDIHGEFPALADINRDIRMLNLAAYAPLKYVLPEKREMYSRKYDNKMTGGSVFRQVDREQSLIHLMRVNLLKRMESSINSFALTTERLLGQVQGILEKIAAHDDGDLEELSIEGLDLDDESFEPFLIGSKIKVLVKDVDRVRWRQELEEDALLLEKLLEESQAIDATRDEKLRQLKALIADKVRHPVNEGNRKVLLFTAFADTAEYLYENLADWAQRDLGVHAAMVTGGSSGNRATLQGIRKDFASIITSFSPISKERDQVDEEATDEIEILIGTDCISEGQNLQDCDFLVNYDIHWNPVRIIQRFGRIDRLGSRNDTIQLVNFWPNMELDEYIDLEARVSGRMVLLDISATGEENIIEFTDAGKMNDLEYRRRQLEQLQAEVVDLEDLSNGISITDMTLNDFRMDLAEYLKQNARRLEQMPPGVFTAVDARLLPDGDGLEPGAIFCLRTTNEKLQPDASYPLAPYYLVYVSDGGDVPLSFTQAKRSLDVLKKVAAGRAEPDDSAYRRFDRATRDGKDMSHYQGLLAQAITAVTGKAQERGVESLFQRGGTVMTKDSFHGIDDFEVVAYVAVMGEGEAGS